MSESVHPIRAYRNDQIPKVSLDDLAAKIGSTGATLSRIENGKLRLSLDLAQKLSQVTGIPMRDLCPDAAKMFEAAE